MYVFVTSSSLLTTPGLPNRSEYVPRGDEYSKGIVLYKIHIANLMFFLFGCYGAYVCYQAPQLHQQSRRCWNYLRCVHTPSCTPCSRRQKSCSSASVRNNFAGARKKPPHDVDTLFFPLLPVPATHNEREPPYTQDKFIQGWVGLSRAFFLLESVVFETR